MTENGGGGDVERTCAKSSEKMNIDNENEVSENTNKTLNKTMKRVKQYGDKNKGPFVVCIRAIDKPLAALKIMKNIYNEYKSAKISIRQINKFKMNVIFDPTINDDDHLQLARVEANKLASADLKESCRIYIPEKLVEVVGCISLSSEENAEEIVEFGIGKFKNPLLPPVDVLEAVRFEKIIEEAGSEPTRELTNTVRVVFDGLLLPEFLAIDGLLIPVRGFVRKQMFCDICLKYNHTKDHCNNKPYKADKKDKKCIHCQSDDHKTGDLTCPKRKLLEQRQKGDSKVTHKKTYAQLLQELDPNASLNNTDHESHFPLNLGTRNSRLKMQQRQSVSSDDNGGQFVKKRKHENDSEEQIHLPPGFRNSNDAEENENDITKFIKSFLLDMALPPFITQLIIKFAVPFINKLVNQFTTSFFDKMSQFGSQ